jgi:carbon monoxide dehydrogenase subunit G
VTILAGNTTQTFNVPVLVDTLDEASETATLTLSNASNATISDATGTLTITDDDDAPTLSINDVSYTESGSAGNATFTVTLSEASAQEVRVSYASSDVSTTEDSDYTGISGTVAIAPGSTSATIDLPILVDTLDEASETATLTLSSPTNATISDATGTLTIVDDDDPPSLSINDVSYDESGTAGNATFTVTLSSASSQEVTVNYASSDVSTAAGSDYTGVSGTVTIAAGATSATFNVPVLTDTLDEATETATLTLSDATNATISDATGELEIKDDDTAPTLSINDISFTEATGDATLTVTLSKVSGQDVTVEYGTTIDGTATDSVDYTVGAGTITIPAGSTTATIDVAVIGDSLDEPNETINVLISNPTGATITDNIGVITINDDDDLPTLSIDDVSYTESGTAGNATFTVTLSAASSKEVTVDYASSNNSATAASDYTAVSGTVTIAAGATTATFNVPVLTDTLDEANETATLTLSNASNATISDATGTLTIVDDDDPPSLSINDVSYTESGSAGNATFTVTLSEASTQEITFNYASSNSSATAGSDYTAASGTLTIAAGATSATFNVPVLVDTLDEANETAILTISNASNATISDATGTLTIVDDDTPPSLSINNVSYTESGSAGNATFTVTLSEASGQEVTVDYASSNSSATAGSDYTAVSGTVTIAAGNTTQTFNVPVSVDTLDENNETAILTLSNPTNATIPVSTIQIGSDIDGEAANDQSGRSVSLSDDGTVVAIGAYANDGNGTSAGHVRIYENNSGTWSQIGSDIDGEAASDQSSYSISLSGDGSIVAIGARYNDGNGTSAGHVRIYENNSGTWTQIGSDIDGEAASDHSGTAVSLSGDGSIVAIGAYGNDGNGLNAGHVRVYQNNSGTWTQIGSDIDGEAGADAAAHHNNIALSDDGSILAIGAYGNDGNGTNSGHVRVYQNNSGTWTQIGSDIDGEAEYDQSGYSVSLSDDGSIVAIGAYANDDNGTNSGHVRVYQNVSGTWTQIGSDIDGEAAGDQSGLSMSLSGDGSIVAIGAYANDGNGTNSGHVRLYQNISGTWTQIGSDIDGEAAYDSSGWSVSLSGDGTAVAIGAYGNDGNGSGSGHVRVYDTNSGTGTLTIIDDDIPSLSINDVSYTESGSAGNATFTVTLSEVSTKDVSVNYASSNSSATAGSDYTAASGTVTIAAGNTTQTFNVPVLVDTLDEANETAIITLSNASNATISDATGTLTIVDDDTPPSLSINDVSYTESGSAGNATFTVTLSATSTQDVTVNYASSNSSATAGSDYTAVSGTVTIAAGNTTQTFNVPVSVDTLDENNETATITLSGASNATISDATGILTIVDNDSIPSLSINNVSYTESGSAGNATFTVSLSSASGKNIEVDYATSNNTAIAGSDYTARSGTVTILAGNTSQTFTVPVSVDTLDEDNEYAILTLSGATNASISDGTGVLTIVDNDSAPSISISNNAMTENSANLSFTVTLSAASSREITVNYSTANNTATAGSDYTAVSATTLTFAAGQTSKTINVGVLEDTVDENNEYFLVNLTSASNATISDSQAIGTIYDDDVTEVEPSLSINNVGVYENNGPLTFTVTASGTYSQNITFNYATSNGSASSSSDYSAISGTGTITAGSTTKTISVNVTNDSVYENTEAMYLNIGTASNATINDSQGVGYIYNDDAQCDADGITYVSNVVIDNSANNFQSERNAGSARSNDHPDDRFIITAEQVDSQWSGTSSQYFSNYTGGSNNVVYGRNKAGNSTTYRVTDGDYFNSYLVFLNNDVNRRVSGTGTIRFEHNIMGVYIGYADTTSTPSIMSQFEKSGATYATSSANRAGNRHFEYTNGDWISMTTSGTYAYKELTLGAKDAQDGDFMRVITNSCLTDGIVVGVEYTTSSGLKGLTDHEGNFSHYVGDDVTFNIGGVVLGTATAEDLAEGRVFLQDIADVDRTTLNGTYLENMATFLQSLDDNNDAYDNIVISQTIRDALVHESLDLRTASEEEVEQLINKVGGIWVDEEDAMTHVKDMLIKYSDLTEADFEDTASPSSSDVLVDVIDTDLLVDEYKASDNASALEEPVLAGVDESTIDLSDLLDVPGDEIDSLMEENDADDEPANEASVDQTGEGEDVSIDGSAVAPFELVDSLLGEVTTPVEV